ncbi:raffinose/stachyose/melibiose transport system substrate-binding protein [Paenibacillus taihuensis]|uniref:Raffinose/stachyose/melibiose transport system substrate-binding protein n=1 Tax=Paenibacillus taihuensis TaxID=1156355 RepID=A0A3D9RZ76_9BACL|nr:extracellular solute-binding protein [Paenibacillus taihuensis]REE85368.1 raffinose/stachyose/melibiose transport system substrate-binding protein [Paenibacillus taihuensis]
MAAKKWMTVAATAALVPALLTACGSNSNNSNEANAGSNTSTNANSGANDSASTEPVEITILQYAPEMTESINKLAADYKKEHPNVTITATIHQDDYPTLLKSRINSGDIPDIFMTGAYNENKTYQDYVYDLKDEPFMKNIVPTALPGVTLDGKVLGFPLVLQSHSFIYNKKLFADAGITELPKTFAELEDAAKKLQAKGVIPFSNGYKEWWVLEQTFTQVLASMGGDYAKTFDELNSGDKKLFDIPEASNVFKLIDLTTKYGNPKPLETDLNSQVALFAEGKAAMMHQGTWVEDSVRKLNPNIDMGFMPGPVGDDASKAGLMVDSNIVWRVNKDSDHLKEVLKFLEWMTTSDAGKSFIPVGTKQISTVASAPFPDAQLSKETQTFLEGGVTYPWVKGYWPDGFEQKAGEILQKYIAGGASADEAEAEMNKTYKTLAEAAE